MLARNLEVKEDMDCLASDLRYIKADHLSIAAGQLDAASVIGQANSTLGTLAGALVDPTHRNVRFLVIESRGFLRRHRHLLPFGHTRFDRAQQALFVDANAADLEEVRMDRFAPFTDDDLITAIFSPRAAKPVSGSSVAARPGPSHALPLGRAAADAPSRIAPFLSIAKPHACSPD